MSIEQVISEAEIDVQESFLLYQQIMSEANKLHPQYQGLVADEFASALRDPRVYNTEIKQNDTLVELPQLAPVVTFDWLNGDFYSRQFPEDYSTGSLLHFTFMAGIEPGGAVRSGIEELAERRGVLVFDSPTGALDHRQKVKELIGGLGVDIIEEQKLGTQTYFAGQVQLKRDHLKRDHPMDMLAAYDELVMAGKYPQSIEDVEEGALLVRSIDENRAEVLRQLYDDAYVVLNDHPCKQGLSADEFKEMLVSDQEVGKLIFIRNGTIETLCLLTNDLSKLSWVNSGYYEQMYPEKFSKKQMVWFPGIATDPEKQGERNTGHLINLMAELAEYGDNEFVGLFDFCDVNTGWLDRVFEDMINEAPETAISLKPIEEQVYWALRLAPRSQ